MRQIPSRRPLFLDRANPYVNAPWTGATWAILNGRAYNTPTYGSDILTNGDMELDSNWSNFATPTTNERSVAQVHGGTYSRRFVSDAIADGVLSATFAMTAGTWYEVAGWMYAPSLAITIARNDGAVANFIATYALGAGWTNFRLASRCLAGGNNAIRVQASTAGAANEHFIDDFSVKALTLTSGIASISADPAFVAVAKINALVSNSLTGVVANWDGSNDGLFAYHDGVGVIFDKVSGGTWTNLIARVTRPFVVDAALEIRRPSGNIRQVWYGGAQVGTDITVDDADINAATRYGLFSTYSGNLFTEFTLDGFVVPFGLPGL